MMMRAISKRSSDMLWALFGAATMILFAPVMIESWDWMQVWYDDAYPPARASLHSAEFMDPTTLRLRFNVQRTARECQFIRVNGYTGLHAGQMFPATTLRREDGRDPDSYPSGMRVTSEPWILSPVYGRQLLLVGHYDCSGRLVRARLIDQVLP